MLDLNGFKLGGPGAGPGTTAVGIFAEDRQNVTIKNGTIRGFFEGIVLEDGGASQGHVVEDIRADQNTIIGFTLRAPATSSATTEVTGGLAVNNRITGADRSSAARMRVTTTEGAGA